MPKTAERAPRVTKFHIYKVTLNGADRLIRSTSRAKAIKFAVEPIEAIIPTPDELVDLVKQDVEVEDAVTE